MGYIKMKIGEKQVEFSLGLKRKVPINFEIWNIDEEVFYVLQTLGDFTPAPIRDALKREVRLMEKYKYIFYTDSLSEVMGKRYAWAVPATPHNDFAIGFLTGTNPYARWRTEYPATKPSRHNLRDHQIEMLTHVWSKRHVHITGDMGLGKSLIAIEAMEMLRDKHNLMSHELWYVGPRSAKESFRLELSKWKSTVRPELLTYEGLTKKAKEHRGPAPRALILDESSKVKNPGAQRSQAAYHVANTIRKEYGYDSLIVLMSGTPAPKSPLDWFQQARIARPGYLAEATIQNFEKRLAIKEMRDSITGGSYPHLVTFRDNEDKCLHCGLFETEHESHAPIYNIPKEVPGEDMPSVPEHKWERSINEVAKIQRRLSGLTMVKLKEDCLDLPPKQYKVIRVKPTKETVMAAQLIKKTARSAALALTKFRQLTDGFNYTTMEDGMETCSLCLGTGKDQEPVVPEDFDPTAPQSFDSIAWEMQESVCCNCGGEGEVVKYVRGVTRVDCPKDDVLLDYLDMHEDIGRFVVLAGFTGTIQRLVDLCHQQGWTTLRLDGRAWEGLTPEGEKVPVDDLLKAMDYSHPDRMDLLLKYKKVVVVGNPKSCSMGLTLTSSPTILYYSNDYDAEARIQSEARVHRMGGRPIPVNIVDIIHLSIDRLVQAKLKDKQDLQTMSITGLMAELEKYEDD